MKWIILFSTAAVLLLCPVNGSYETGPGYGATHSSYPAAPVAHGWGKGHAAGSYYHYHVPLVGEQPHYHPPQQQQSNDHHLYLLLPLLLLAALPLLFLPLLPLLLLPLGLSLLALLLPLLMMGGMMMMMMMDGGMMMMMMRNHGAPPTRHGYGGGGGDSRSFGNLVYHDVHGLLSRYARSLDLDHCPERVTCEAGHFLMFPQNETDTARSSARLLMDLVETIPYIPKGERSLIRRYKRAFGTGSKTGNCSEFTCQPVFRIPIDEYPAAPAHNPGNIDQGNNTVTATSYPGNYYKQEDQVKGYNKNYYYDYYNMGNSSSYGMSPSNYYATARPVLLNQQPGKILKKIYKSKVSKSKSPLSQ